MWFVAGVRWVVRAKDAGSAHMQCHMGATEDTGSRRPSAARRHKAQRVGASQLAESSHSPVQVYSTIRASIAYCVCTAVRAEPQIATARSCASMSPTT
jgi:hypothetical protein